MEKLALIREALFLKGLRVWTVYASTDKKSVTTLMEGVPVAEGLPEEVDAIANSRKNDRDRSTLTTGYSYACSAPGGGFPAKFGCQPMKLELCLLVHTHPAHRVRVHFRLLGVYKGSRVSYRAIWVRVSYGLVLELGLNCKP